MKIKAIFFLTFLGYNASLICSEKNNSTVLPMVAIPLTTYCGLKIGHKIAPFPAALFAATVKSVAPTKKLPAICTLFATQITGTLIGGYYGYRAGQEICSIAKQSSNK